MRVQDKTSTGFDSLDLIDKLVATLAELGYTEPTPIQREAIPPLVAGRDLVGLAGTGTGKTAAFALPLVQRIAAVEERDGVAGLVLVPTRELAIQVASAITKYGKSLGIRVVPVYGGSSFSEQARALRRGSDVVVATPGRALDHIRRNTLKLDGISAVVLDEADEMLDMGFADDLEAILSETPKERQTMFFSATMPPRITAIAAKHLTNPVRTAVKAAPAKAGETPQVRQTAYIVRRDQKAAALVRVLEYENPTSAIVFCRTRNEADALAEALAAADRRPESIHGGLSQEHRDRVMQKFRDGGTTILVATDVAARGLDIGHLSHVVNYGMPESADTYTHRIGRVGRAGREGVAITIGESRERHQLRCVERASGRPIEFRDVPSVADLREKHIERTRATLREAIAAGGFADAERVVAPLVAEFGVEVVALAAIKRFAERPQAPEDKQEIHGGGAGKSARPPREFTPRQRNNSMARLYVGAGRLSGMNRRDLIDVIGNQAGIDPRDLGDIRVAERFSLVDVPHEAAEHVIEYLNGARFRGRPVTVRRDRGDGMGI
ncbi:MAG: DEAD/DEAH box helicase [Gemmataceae bacterium]|nr:DEAD/DEAH box helicase [Gemmataceae bacterium]